MADASRPIPIGAAIYASAHRTVQPPDDRTYSAEVTGPSPQSPASSHLQRSRAYHFPVTRFTIIQDRWTNVKQFFDLFYNLCSHFSVETPIFSVESLLWSFYPKYRISFPFTSVISPCVSAPRCGSDRPPPLRCRRRDAPPPCRMPAVLSRHLPEQRRIVRPKSPAKNFFGGAIKRPRPALYKRAATQAPPENC